MKNFALIQKKANNFFGTLINSGLETTITYKKFRSSTFNDSTGMQETTYDEYAVDAVRVNTALDAQKGTSLTSGVFNGGLEYLIKAEDCPRTNIYDPDILKDYIIDNGIEKIVKTSLLLVNTFVRLGV